VFNDHNVMLEVYKAHRQEVLDEARREQLVRLALGSHPSLWARLQKLWMALADDLRARMSIPAECTLEPTMCYA
jgi:hypothetical protein